jgi:uncharacterized protein (DUF302 family)
MLRDGDEEAAMRTRNAWRGAILAAAAILPMLTSAAPPAVAQPEGPVPQAEGTVTLPSRHTPRTTLDRFAEAVRAAGWVVFTEIDHAVAAREVGLAMAPRTVVFFGNPRAGTPGMVAMPTLALDLPMRVLVWQDPEGRVFVTRSTGEDIAKRIFARHGVEVPPEQREATEALMDRLARQAAG